MPNKDNDYNIDDWIFSSPNKYKAKTSDKLTEMEDYYSIYNTAKDYLPDDEVRYNKRIYIVKSRNTHNDTLLLSPKWKSSYMLTAKEETVKASEVIMHKPLGGSVYTGWGVGGYQQCSHKMVEYKFPKTKDLSIYMSSHRAGTLDSDIVPTHGVYLDPCWNDEMFTFNNVYWSISATLDIIDIKKQKKMFVDWQDQQAIPLTDFELLIEHCWRLISMGTLEIGCIGGHGRTGTLLGGMILYHSYLIKEPITFKTAIETVREKYCNQAIESKAQENLLQEYSMLLGDTYESNR